MAAIRRSAIRSCTWWKCLVACTIAAGLIAAGLYSTQSDNFFDRLKTVQVSGESDSLDYFVPDDIVPAALMGTVYNESDFRNSQGITPPFWDNSNNTWGPCYPPNNPVDWKVLLEHAENNPEPYYKKAPKTRQEDSVAGFCRPGFIIIGAGKCGTSSLYHYLVSHPRVVPASEKQIHYFKYYAQYSMSWYYHHFPSTKSFLASGALMSGEASPGYIPYPDVARMVRHRLPGPRIIAVGREPVSRSYSSYRYNYVDPTLDALRKGKVKGINGGGSDEEYQQYLFSFEDMMKAELVNLRECFADGSEASVGARNKWTKQRWAQKEYERREKEGLPTLIDLDGFCYGDKVSAKILRKQWTDLVATYPDKIILDRNLHLTQSFIGRGLYALPLEWWYANYPKEEIYFVCTEEMSDLSGEPMNKLGSYLGLPDFNFSEVVSAGAYNVGGHKGYDEETSWADIQAEKNSTLPGNATEEEIPLSDEFRLELEEFVRPYNERLFDLTGRRCNW